MPVSFAFPYIQKVVHLFKCGTREWDLVTIAACFDAETQSKILSIRIPLTGVDQFKWSLSQNGDFSVKSLYTQLNPVNNLHNLDWNRVWSLQVLPRIHTFVWKCLHNILPVNARIAAILNDIDPRCPMCSKHSETVYHLLMECDFARAVWFALPVGIAMIMVGIMSKLIGLHGVLLLLGLFGKLVVKRYSIDYLNVTNPMGIGISLTNYT
ncbi:Reverse transcriptase zinc-binding domain [Macleaya cordata]|uniref:Reverse transcriptase zinc-binding domain n=1 Tax=Macleaya cordata TaxID=56857 RepID=A0A200Q7K5_MACCD|nr:Reverse transcriptase zinc-binding domain [Macleaya cordata]